MESGADDSMQIKIDILAFVALYYIILEAFQVCRDFQEVATIFWNSRQLRRISTSEADFYVNTVKTTYFFLNFAQYQIL